MCGGAPATCEGFGCIDVAIGGNWRQARPPVLTWMLPLLRFYRPVCLIACYTRFRPPMPTAVVTVPIKPPVLAAAGLALGLCLEYLAPGALPDIIRGAGLLPRSAAAHCGATAAAAAGTAAGTLGRTGPPALKASALPSPAGCSCPCRWGQAACCSWVPQGRSWAGTGERASTQRSLQAKARHLAVAGCQTNPRGSNLFGHPKRTRQRTNRLDPTCAPGCTPASAPCASSSPLAPLA